jgi:hypothetical protein
VTITYHGSLPPGALVTHRPENPPAEGSAPVWLDAAAGEFEVMPGDPSRIRRWIDPEAELAAIAVGPNLSGTRHEAGPGRPALVFEAGVNGGLVLAGAIADAGRVGFGAIFEPAEADAETLLTLQPLGVKDYLYLAARGTELRAEQDAGDFGLVQSLNAPAGAPVLVLCSVTGAEVRLSANGGAPITGTLAGAGFSGPADLFIGCRGQRPGLKKKLGSFRLLHAFAWSGEDIGGEAAEAMTELWRSLHDA